MAYDKDDPIACGATTIDGKNDDIIVARQQR